MELRNLRSLLKIAELGSFAKAAGSLGYAQSSITAQIHSLEGELGFPLFEKIGKRNVLTPAGRQLVSYAAQIASLEEEMRQIGDIPPEAIKGAIRIGTVESVLNATIINIIDDYQTRFPHISITIKTGNTALLSDMLRTNEVDIIFCIGEGTEVPGFISAGNIIEQCVFFCHRDNPLASKKHLIVKDIFDSRFITLTPENYLYRVLTARALALGKELDTGIQAESSQLIVHLVEKNLGVSFLPKSQIEASADKSKIVVLKPSDFEFSCYMNIFYHKNKWLTKPMEALFQSVNMYMSEHYSAGSIQSSMPQN